MKKEFVKTALLLDLYGDLLSQRQKTCLELYYHEDYSLTEIAKLLDITPQGAKHHVGQGFDVLVRREEQLGFLTRFEQIAQFATEIESTLQSIAEEDNTLAEHFAPIYKILEQLQL